MYWVKLTPNVLFYQPKLVCLNPVFSRVWQSVHYVLREIKADGRKLHSIFFLILQKSKDNFFIVYVYK